MPRIGFRTIFAPLPVLLLLCATGPAHARTHEASSRVPQVGKVNFPELLLAGSAART